MSGIGSINDLTNLGNGVYQMNFSGTPNRGFVTSDNNVLAPLWYCKMKMKFDTNWNWGSTVYGGASQYLSNNKILRFWNPGDTKENCYVELTGYEDNGNGAAKFVIEDASGNQAFQRYFLGNFKNTLKAGSEHIFEFEFKENASFKVWLNGAQIADISGFQSDKTGIPKRVYCLGLENEWNSGTKYGNNTLTLSELAMAENKTRDQYNGGTVPTPVPTPTPIPTPTPAPIYATKAEVDAVNADLQALKQKLRSV